MANHLWQRDGYTVSTEREKLNFDVIHAFLKDSYWGQRITCERLRRAMEHSLCFGLYYSQRQVRRDSVPGESRRRFTRGVLYQKARQIGFARIVTDYCNVGYLADVFVLEEFRGQGLGQWLVGCAISHPDLAEVRRLLLATRDAHGLYKKLGFTSLEEPELYMSLRKRPDLAPPAL